MFIWEKMFQTELITEICFKGLIRVFVEVLFMIIVANLLEGTKE